MISAIRRHIGWKIFLSYMVVIVVGVIVLATATEFILPRAFDRHLASMGTMMMGMMGSSSTGMDLNSDLFTGFRSAVNEAFTVAAIAALIAAIAVSFFVSRQVVIPVKEMMIASRYIADGHFEERVHVPGNPSKGEFDELSQLALSFNQMAAKLDQVETMRRQLIGDISHELRTPLTAIKGSMEGLIDGVLPANEETFLNIYREADRLQRLVSDLQELSRVEAGAFKLDIQPLELSSLVKMTVNRLVLQFEEKGVALESDVSDSLPSLLADEDRIGQVLLNLVGNALQYTPSGGRVQIVSTQFDDEIRIAVIDDGIGIPTEHLNLLFTRFYRVDKSRARVGGGSGIGLTIAKYLVEAHGGRIWAESPGPELGSTFTISLPIAM